VSDLPKKETESRMTIQPDTLDYPGLITFNQKGGDNKCKEKSI
jgi:hypothetical protein